MTSSARFWGSLFCGLFLFSLDQLLKFFAQTMPFFTAYLVPHWIGWEYFANPGVAFGVPVPNGVIVVITPIIVFFLLLSFLRSSRLRQQWALILIIGGATSNFIDRVLFGVTIDYIRLFTAVINIADLMIVGGGLLLLWDKKTHQA